MYRLRCCIPARDSCSFMLRTKVHLLQMKLSHHARAVGLTHFMAVMHARLAGHLPIYLSCMPLQVFHCLQLLALTAPGAAVPTTPSSTSGTTGNTSTPRTPLMCPLMCGAAAEGGPMGVMMHAAQAHAQRVWALSRAAAAEAVPDPPGTFVLHARSCAIISIQRSWHHTLQTRMKWLPLPATSFEVAHIIWHTPQCPAP
jgi:hypothetical protein